MKKIDLGQTITILANVGVIAGIFFLGVELRQNNELLAAQARSDLANRRTGFMEIIMQSPDLSELVVKASSNVPMTAAEQVRFSQVGRRIIASWESLYLEVYNGVFAQESLPIREWRGLYYGVAGPDYQLRQAWESFEKTATPQFVAFMQESVIEPGPP